jgi:3-oxoacyl-[acyl-carrier-protein] synthase II
MGELFWSWQRSGFLFNGGRMKRVAITGMGVVSPVGSGVDRFWANLVTGRSGIGEITLFDASTFPVRIGGEVDDLDIDSVIERFGLAADQRDRKIPLALAAAAEAVADSGLSDADLRTASLQFGVGLEALFMEDLTPYAHSDDIGFDLASAVASGRLERSCQSPADRVSDILGLRYGLTGGRWINCSACAAGAQVIGEAFDMIRGGDCEVVLAGAADSMLNPLGLGGFSLLRVLSNENDAPQSACRPFSGDRKGTVLGEGAGFVVLESMDRALARGAEIYAELLGYGSSMDAYRVSDPSPTGRGAVLSMTEALRDAGLTPKQIDCISAHGTGTPQNDIVETAAIKNALGSRAVEIPVHAVKSMTGHMIAASGAVEAVAAILTIGRGRVPATINLRQADVECDLDYVPGSSREFDGRTVMSNSFGFGGQNATLIFGRAS